MPNDPSAGPILPDLTLTIERQTSSYIDSLGEEAGAFVRKAGKVVDSVLRSFRDVGGDTDIGLMLSHGRARIAELVAIHLACLSAKYQKAVSDIVLGILDTALSFVFCSVFLPPRAVAPQRGAAPPVAIGTDGWPAWRRPS